MEQWYREHPDATSLNGRTPPIDVYFLVERAPELNERESRSWDAYNLKMLTYKGLITNAKLAYASYLSIHQQTGNRLVKLLESLQG